MSQSIRLPHNWGTLTTAQKESYLVNTRQARDFSHAGRILNEFKQRKKERQQAQSNAPLTHQPLREVRLPYRDD